MIHQNLFSLTLCPSDINDCENNFWSQWQNIRKTKEAVFIETEAQDLALAYPRSL
jgi:hypothetical protein